MNLEEIYYGIKKIIDTVDFSLLWDGFSPLQFAVYNKEECFFDGSYVPKTDAFIANTAIMYNDEYIAIWNVMGEVDYKVLASKLIHEMFHGFQMINSESRFTNEIEALLKYKYSDVNLSIKMEENILLSSLIKNFNRADYSRFLSLRKYRLLNFEYEYRYESSIEQIEGSANYVELNALKQISEEKYNLKIAGILNEICNPKNYFPIRIVSYSIGALIFELLKKNNMFCFKPFSKEPVSVSFLEDELAYNGQLPYFSEIDSIINDYNNVTDNIIQKTLLSNNCVLDGEYELLGVNVYNARYYNDYIVSTYFVMFMDNGRESVLYGDFVIKINSENKINKVYKIES
jgi:hypothetical protein